MNEKQITNLAFQEAQKISNERAASAKKNGLMKENHFRPPFCKASFQKGALWLFKFLLEKQRKTTPGEG